MTKTILEGIALGLIIVFLNVLGVLIAYLILRDKSSEKTEAKA